MKTLIAVPCHEMVHAEFMRCLINLEKPEETGYTQVVNTLIYQARNLIAFKAVEMGFDRVLWLDSDMTFPENTLIALSETMDNLDADIVSALCFTRKQPIKPTIYDRLHWEINDDGWVITECTPMTDYPANAIFPAEACGFGCVLTSTRILKAMIDKYGSPFYPLMGMGEDTTFCWRVKQNDGSLIWCDSTVKCGHIGQVEYNEEIWRASNGRGTNTDA